MTEVSEGNGASGFRATLEQGLDALATVKRQVAAAEEAISTLLYQIETSENPKILYPLT